MSAGPLIPGRGPLPLRSGGGHQQPSGSGGGAPYNRPPPGVRGAPSSLPPISRGPPLAGPPGMPHPHAPPLIGGPPPPGGPLLAHGGLPPAPHVNPAFFPQVRHFQCELSNLHITKVTCTGILALLVQTE